MIDFHSFRETEDGMQDIVYIVKKAFNNGILLRYEQRK